MLAFDNDQTGYSGLDQISNVGVGKASDLSNPTNRKADMKDGQRYTFEAQVELKGTDTTISVLLDGRPYLTWTGPQSSLNLWPNWQTENPKMLAIGLGDVDVSVEQLELIPHDGEVLVLDDTPIPSKGVQVIRGAEPIDLLPVIHPELDVFDGKAKRTEQGMSLTATPTKSSRLGVPVRAIGAYELELSLERTAGTRTISIGLPTSGTRGACVFDAGRTGFLASGIEMIVGDGAGERGNPATVEGTQFAIGAKHDFLFRVHPQGTRVAVEVEMDGKAFCQWEGEQADWTLYKDWEIPNTQIPFIGCHDSSILIHSATLKMLDGEAWILRSKAEPK